MAQCAVAELKHDCRLFLEPQDVVVSMAQCAVAELKQLKAEITAGPLSVFPWRSAPWPN